MTTEFGRKPGVRGDEQLIPSSAQVLDESVLDALAQLQVSSRPDFVIQVITLFMETALGLLRDLENGVATDQIAMLHHASHSLKGCSATIGAVSLAMVCGELETIARAGAVPDAAARVEAILHEYRQVEAALVNRLAKQSTADRAQKHLTAGAHPPEQI
jgi:HPt (histidine-containing phosphotransfer) domain-containing protein